MNIECIADRLHVSSEGLKEIKEESSVFGLSNWVVPFSHMGLPGWSTLGQRKGWNQEFCSLLSWGCLLVSKWRYHRHLYTWG